MTRGFTLLLASASALSFASAASAQASGEASPDDAAAAVARTEEAEATGSSEIVVTARRRAESLQDVPQTVNAVTSEQIEKLRLTTFSDIQSIVPGLTLLSASNGFSNTASMRGASFTVETGAKPTVVMYINEAPIEPNIVFASMFDIGQIEVLRGPQGTLRGRSAPSGAITISTRRPDLDEFGGTFNTSLTSHSAINAQAAVGVPIIPGVLAIRVAGVIDHDDVDGVKSVNTGIDPSTRTESGRVSLRFEPTDTLSATVMYQYLHRKTRRYSQVVGNGAPGGTVASYRLGNFSYPARAAPPAGYNGPPIDAFDRLAVQESPLQLDQKFQILTANIDWEVFGQKLSYVGGWSNQDTFSFGGGDTFNSYIGSIDQNLDNVNTYTSHELRLSSVERIARIFDYTVGGFWFTEKTDTHTTQRRFNPGAFGAPPANTALPQPLVPFDPAYVSATEILRRGKTKEMAVFGTLTAHIGDRTELTGGVRHITWKERPTGPFFPDPTLTPAQLYGTGSTICAGAARARLPAALGGLVITTPTTCVLNAANPDDTTDKAWVYNLSASHKFTEDLMVYATYGTSWRAGPFSVAPFDLDFAGYASSSDLRFHDPEKSKSIELGVKASFLDKRARLNVAVYRQTFKDYFYFSNSTYYLTFANGGPSTVSTFNFTANADAKAWGIDVDAAFQITPEWDMSAAFSWAKGKVGNDDVPCRDGNFDGTPDNIVPTVQGFIDHKVIVARCQVNDSISQTPRWNLSLQSEYAHPISDHVDGFLRGQFTYYPKNPFKSPDIVIDNYGLLNLFLGVRSPDRDWEINVFAKNITKTTKITDYTLNTVPNQFYGDPGYSSVQLTPRREFGVNVRVAFGSR